MHFQDEFTMLSINGLQTINVIGPGDQARGGRSYIIDFLTSYYMRPVPETRVNYDIGAC